MDHVLEVALAHDFEDRLTHLAYADFLSERGYARGELVLVQLALEDSTHSADEQLRLRCAEAALVQECFSELLRAMSPYVQEQLTFRRGWLRRANFQRFSRDIAEALAASAGARLLQSLSIQRFLGDVTAVCRGLSGAGFLPALREFAVHDLYPMTWPCRSEIAGLLEQMAQLETLILGETHAADAFLAALSPTVRTVQTRLRRGEDLQTMLQCRPVLEVETLVLEAVHPRLSLEQQIRSGLLTRFFSPQQWPRLRSLTLRGLELGDSGCAALARSGLVFQLRNLTLLQAGIETALPLCECPGIGHLELLDLGGICPDFARELRIACPGWKNSRPTGGLADLDEQADGDELWE